MPYDNPNLSVPVRATIRARPYHTNADDISCIPLRGRKIRFSRLTAGILFISSVSAYPVISKRKDTFICLFTKSIQVDVSRYFEMKYLNIRLPYFVSMSEHPFPCPKCKGYTRVYHGKRLHKGLSEPSYQRYRKCTACGYTYQTIEVFYREDGRTKSGERGVV